MQYVVLDTAISAVSKNKVHTKISKFSIPME